MNENCPEFGFVFEFVMVVALLFHVVFAWVGVRGLAAPPIYVVGVGMSS